MGHDKLRKFAENETFRCLLQPGSGEVLVPSQEPGLHLKDHPVKGNWCSRMFDAPRPIVLELGCGKGDYTIALALKHPEFNYIGVDIKGARLWKGAKYATENSLGNVAFLRTRIEFLEAFFAPGEISQIWLTFSDPQMKSENSRLTSPLFLERYRSVMARGGVVHLKTDSRLLHHFTRETVLQNGLPLIEACEDIYGTGRADDLLSIQTFYEKNFRAQGIPITYMAFRLDKTGPLVEPEWDQEPYEQTYKTLTRS